MPLGVVLDGICRGKNTVEKYRALPCLLFWELCLLGGGFTHVIVLGIGNALFHVGGGVGTIWTSEGERSVCTRLGIFVASGALGLFLGNMWSRFAYKTWIAFTGTFLLLCFGGMLLWLGRGEGFGSSWGRFGKHKAVPERSMVVICCFW